MSDALEQALEEAYKDCQQHKMANVQRKTSASDFFNGA
jgi:hypothetical protein